ncbi:conserved hypothetical protein, partial [delta proteobacterium NaphS2]
MTQCNATGIVQVHTLCGLADSKLDEHAHIILIG